LSLSRPENSWNATCYASNNNQSISAVVIVIGINSIEKQLGIPHWILMEKNDPW
jgi:hypothetical protein